jgi:hypothetical protein
MMLDRSTLRAISTVVAVVTITSMVLLLVVPLFY